MNRPKGKETGGYEIEKSHWLRSSRCVGHASSYLLFPSPFLTALAAQHRVHVRACVCVCVRVCALHARGGVCVAISYHVDVSWQNPWGWRKRCGVAIRGWGKYRLMMRRVVSPLNITSARTCTIHRPVVPVSYNFTMHTYVGRYICIPQIEVQSPSDCLIELTKLARSESGP